MKIVVLFLGENDEYLWNKQFPSMEEADKLLETLQPVILANIENKLSLKDRIKLIPEYFPFVGRVQDFKIIEIEP